MSLLPIDFKFGPTARGVGGYGDRYSRLLLSTFHESPNQLLNHSGRWHTVLLT